MNEPCRRPNCAGTITDGFCDTCGRPPIGAASAVVAHQNIDSKASAKLATAAGSVRGSRTGTSGIASSGSGTGTGGSRGSGRGSGGSSRRGSRGSSRRTLGAGIINLTPMPAVDPLQSIMANPVVPEAKRRCPNCDAKLNLVKGFCPMCGTEYSFVPALQPGALVAGQYEVKGAIAYGGLGWIYLGWDTMLSRWVVLKGLLNTKDTLGAQAAVAERQFLAAVKHPNIVNIYNFVTQGGDGFIVMEYVGGQTLKTIRKERGKLPVAEALAYVHRVLRAFQYLHTMGLVYCDFKPDNFMVEDDDVKLIDLGGVRRDDDPDGQIYGTKGYSPPEMYDDPSPAADLYTVARSLAVLVIDFAFQSTYEFTLPTPNDEPLFVQNPSLYRLLLKATHKEPIKRFQTADEMAAQILGVLRETVVLAGGETRTLDSTQFGGETIGDGDVELPEYHLLPALKPDIEDPATGAILAAAAIRDLDQLSAHFERAWTQFPESLELPLLLAQTRIEQKRYDDAEALLVKAASADPNDWQILWLRGILYLARDRNNEARIMFDHVYAEIPGEIVPKMAIALCAEREGSAKNLADAARFYDMVSRVEPSLTAAAFGLARCRRLTDDRTGTIEAYERVPATSSRYILARIAIAQLLSANYGTSATLDDILRASQTIQSLSLDGYKRHQLTSALLRTAIIQIESGKIAATAAKETILGVPLQSRDLRFELEKELRASARYVASRAEKIELVDAANKARPRTMV